MPFSGGASPSPERYGGPDAPGGEPRLQRVYRSLCAQHGSAYAQDWPPSTPFGIEMAAYARAITFDLFGASERMANQFIPSKMTADGLLSRWELIFNTPPLPGDTEPVRRARVAAAFARLGTPNSHQPIVDALTAALGALFTGNILYSSPNTALKYWPGTANNTATLPWYSQVDVLQIQLTVPPAYLNPISTAPNAAWWASVGQAYLLLDQLLPSWIMWLFFIQSSHLSNCFFLDEPNLDLELLCA
jgi:hypothetical protein